jgi:hypothetical protein
MPYSVVLLLTDILIIGFVSAVIVMAAIALARREDRERAVAPGGITLSEPPSKEPRIARITRIEAHTR